MNVRSLKRITKNKWGGVLKAQDGAQNPNKEIIKDDKKLKFNVEEWKATLKEFLKKAKDRLNSAEREKAIGPLVIAYKQPAKIIKDGGTLS